MVPRNCKIQQAGDSSSLLNLKPLIDTSKITNCDSESGYDASPCFTYGKSSFSELFGMIIPTSMFVFFVFFFSDGLKPPENHNFSHAECSPTVRATQGLLFAEGNRGRVYLDL